MVKLKLKQKLEKIKKFIYYPFHKVKSFIQRLKSSDYDFKKEIRDNFLYVVQYGLIIAIPITKFITGWQGLLAFLTAALASGCLLWVLIDVMKQTKQVFTE